MLPSAVVPPVVVTIEVDLGDALCQTGDRRRPVNRGGRRGSHDAGRCDCRQATSGDDREKYSSHRKISFSSAA